MASVEFHAGLLPEKWHALARELVEFWKVSSPFKDHDISFIVKRVFDEGRSGSIVFLASFGHAKSGEFRRVFKIDLLSKALNEKAGSEYLKQIQARAYCQILNNPGAATIEWPAESGTKWAILEYEYAGGFSDSSTKEVYTLASFTLSYIRSTNNVSIQDFHRIINDDVAHDLRLKLYPPYHRVDGFVKVADAFPGKLDHLSVDLLRKVMRSGIPLQASQSPEQCHSFLLAIIAQQASTNFLEARQLHGDLNPGNILVFERAELHQGVLIDFCEMKFRDHKFRSYYWDFARIECELLLTVFAESLAGDCSPRDFLFHIMSGTTEGSGTLQRSLEIFHTLRRSFFGRGPVLDVPPAGEETAKIFTVTTLVFFLFYLKFHESPGEEKKVPLALAFALAVCDLLSDFRPAFLNAIETKKKRGRMVGFPYASVDLFIGRREEIQKVERAFKTHSTVFLSGMTGQGKTHLAVKYALEHRQHYNYIFWISGENAEGIRDALAGFAREILAAELASLEISEHTASVESRNSDEMLESDGFSSRSAGVSVKIIERDPAQVFKNWLLAREDWLLIVDNIDDALDLKELPPHTRGHTLITTQLTNLLHTGGSVVPIESLSPEHALALLIQRSSGRDFDSGSLTPTALNDARQIVKELGFHALAIDQAGAYLYPDQEFARYQNLLRNALNDVLGRRGAHFSHELAVTASFQVACDRIADINPLALRILEACAFLSPDSIPVEFFERAVHSEEFDAAQEILRALRGLSLLTRDPETNSLRMHRLLQKFLQNTIFPEARIERLTELVAVFDPWLTEAPVSHLTQPLLSCCEHLAYRILESECKDEHFLKFATLVGSNLLDGRQFSEATKLLELAVNVGSAQDIGDENLFTMCHLIARGNYELTENEVSIQWWTRVLEAHIKIDPESENVAYVKHEIGNCQKRLNQYDAAIESYQQAIRIRRVQSQFSRGTAVSINALAWVYMEAENYPRAIEAFSESLDCYRNAPDATAEEVASELNALGLAHFRHKQYSEALIHFKESLRIRLPGGDSEETGTSLNNVGATYFRLGLYSDAIDYHKQACELRHRLMLKAPEADSQIELGRTFFAIGEIPSAVGAYRSAFALQMGAELYAEALTTLKVLAQEVRERQSKEAAGQLVGELFEEYPVLIEKSQKDSILCNGVGMVYGDGTGDAGKGLGYYEMAAALEESKQVVNQITLATYLYNIGVTFSALGNHEKAADLIQRVIAIRRRELTAGHTDTIHAINRLGTANFDLQNYQKARDLFEEAVRMSSVPGFDPLNHASFLNNAGKACFLLKDFQAAISYHKQALQIRRSQLPGAHFDIIHAMNDLAVAYSKSNDHETAMAMSEEALRVSYADPGFPSIERATILNNAGFSSFELKDFRRAADYHEEALAIRRKEFGAAHVETITSVFGLALAYREMKDYATSLRLFAEAIQLGETQPGVTATQLATYLSDAGRACSDSNDFNRAIHFHKRALEIRRRELTDQNSFTIHSINELARAYHEFKDYRAALSLFEEAVRLSASLPEISSIERATHLNNAGFSAYYLEELPSALDYLKKSLEIRRRELSERHKDTILTINALGAVYKSMGDPVRALQLYVEALECSESVNEVTPQGRATFLANAGAACQDLGDFWKAVDYHTRALAIRREELTDHHPDTVRSLMDLGTAHFGLAEFTGALTFYQEVIRISAAEPDAISVPDRAIALNQAGFLCGKLNRYVEGIQYYREAIEISKSYSGQATDKATFRMNLVSILIDAQLFDEAYSSARDALRFTRKNLGPSKELGKLYHYIGRIYPARKNTRKALQYDLRAFNIRKSILGKNEATAVSANDVAVCYEELGDLTKAQEFHAIALNIKRAVLSENHASTLASCQHFARVSAKLFDWETAIPAAREALEIARIVHGQEALAYIEAEHTLRHYLERSELPASEPGILTQEEIEASLAGADENPESSKPTMSSEEIDNLLDSFFRDSDQHPE